MRRISGHSGGCLPAPECPVHAERSSGHRPVPAQATQRKHPPPRAYPRHTHPALTRHTRHPAHTRSAHTRHTHPAHTPAPAHAHSRRTPLPDTRILPPSCFFMPPAARPCETANTSGSLEYLPYCAPAPVRRFTATVASHCFGHIFYFHLFQNMP